ncbi:tetratricopeptide repeat protein [Petroclostridium sp. X23]|uniref:tetratricopeptide repeat protein n=1 Tax=Petroclostridium sp. X23 TaxID=3045146 RepID=UPI0024ACE2C1|nr:tetratricopeptide repeat protein [Petroclostridium sp. X23]WHH58845.1 tetratricopeptide repeat protein [Petroclostridium sp. X23]
MNLKKMISCLVVLFLVLSVFPLGVQAETLSVNNYHEKAEQLAAQEKYQEAVEVYKKIIEEVPDDARAYNNLGCILNLLEDYDGAIINFNKAIEINPNNADFYYNKGGALYNMGQYEQAIQAFDKSIEIKPEDAVSYYNKGRALAGLGNCQESLSYFDKAALLEPQSALIILQFKSRVLIQLDKYKENYIFQVNNPLMLADGIKKEIDPENGSVPIRVDGITLIPIERLVEALGGSIRWDEDKSHVSVFIRKKKLDFWMNDDKAYVNEERRTSNTKLVMINGRAYFPLRYIAQGIGCTVEWNEETQVISMIFE